ncbi:MAG TPA: twin-arginine translocase TatA/TatE family subunit [Alphaproteobacteria bacterium]
MGAMSFSHILVVALLAVLLFGRGKISDLMGDLAKGIRSFKRGLAEDEGAAPGAPRLGHEASGATAPADASPKA